MSDEKERPLLITIISVLYFVAGVLMFLFTAWVFYDGITTETLNDTGTVVGAIAAAIGLISFAIGAGFWKGWRIIWKIAVAVGILGLLFCLLMVVSNNLLGFVGLAIQALLLYYIYRPNVKKFFDI